jgi:hypothetical protein
MSRLYAFAFFFVTAELLVKGTGIVNGSIALCLFGVQQIVIA